MKMRNIGRRLKVKRRFIRGDQFHESFWNIVKAFFKILLFPVLFLVLIVALPVITVMAEEKKSFALLLWAALYSSIIVPVAMGSLLWIIPIVPYAIFHFIITIYVYKKTVSDDAATNMGESSATGSREGGRSGEGQRGGESKRGLFEGLLPAEAKKKYHELMKKYHPDNADGNPAMAKEISIAYDEYKLRHRVAR